MNSQGSASQGNTVFSNHTLAEEQLPSLTQVTFKPAIKS